MDKFTINNRIGKKTMPRGIKLENKSEKSQKTQNIKIQK